MVKLFQNQSSTYAFLTAINYTQKGQGLLEWDEQMLLLKNVNLDETRTKISVKEQGIYLVFVQATFKLQASHNASLRLQVNHEYKEREDYITAVFHKQCGATMEIDAVLSHPVLLRIVQGDVISICVEPTELVDFELRPTSSYLLLLKVADL